MNEGVCAEGPVDRFCAIEAFKSCSSNAECTAPGDSCVSRNHECFTESGTIGQSISVAGVASISAPTLGGIGCVGPTRPTVGVFDTILGYPGPARVTLPGTAVIQ